MKRNPDLMKNHLKYRTPHGKRHTQPEETHYEPLLRVNDDVLLAAFPSIFNQDTLSALLPWTRLVRIVDTSRRWFGRVLDDGNSIPQLVRSGEFPTFDSNRRKPEDHPNYTPSQGSSRPSFSVPMSSHAKKQHTEAETKARQHVGSRKGGGAPFDLAST